jgi:hypothetical protein
VHHSLAEPMFERGRSVHVAPVSCWGPTRAARLMLALVLSSGRAEAGPTPSAAPPGGASAKAAPEAAACPEPESCETDPPLPPGAAKRPLPAYRPRATESLSIAAAIPRTLLAPALVASDLVARPVIVLGTAVEKHHVRERLRDFFTFGPHDEFQLYPVAYVDWGFRPSAGAYFSWQRAGAGSEAHVRVMSGGPGYWDARGLWRADVALSLADRVCLDGNLHAAAGNVFGARAIPGAFEQTEGVPVDDNSARVDPVVVASAPCRPRRAAPDAAEAVSKIEQGGAARSPGPRRSLATSTACCLRADRRDPSTRRAGARRAARADPRGARRRCDRLAAPHDSARGRAGARRGSD